MLQLEGLTKYYEGFCALSDMNLSVPPGEFFCFLGPNGAGKTTTIKILAGLLKPSAGRALVDGWDVQKNPMDAKRLIGYIPDNPYLYEKLSGRDFLHFVGDLYEIPRSHQQQALEYYFSIFNLMPSADKLVENYSYGMRQKLCFAAAFMHQPRLLIVDEPMVGLDPLSARTVKNLLRDFCSKGGTVFLSTHLLAIAEELCDRLGIVSKGKLQFLGTVDELRRQLSRKGNLEELFLELTADGVTNQAENPFAVDADGVIPPPPFEVVGPRVTPPN